MQMLRHAVCDSKYSEKIFISWICRPLQGAKSLRGESNSSPYHERAPPFRVYPGTGGGGGEGGGLAKAAGMSDSSPVPAWLKVGPQNGLAMSGGPLEVWEIGEF
jgi:hypothetical protein